MKITVCEFPDEASRNEAAWADLVRFLHTGPTDVVVLPEMPFCDWKIFMTRAVDPSVWQTALAVHDEMLTRLVELRTGMVLASRPVDLEGKRLSASIKPFSGRAAVGITACTASITSQTSPMGGKPLGLRGGTAISRRGSWDR